MGAAGDMLTASLLELLPDKQKFIDTMNALGLPGVRVEALPCKKNGVTGTRVIVTVHGEEESEEHTHSHGSDYNHTALHDIDHCISHLNVSEKVKSDAVAVYRLIAEAESAVHGEPVELVHFHEVGALDAVADIVGVCLLMETLAPDRVLASPVHVGSGTVRCAHGILPVPSPAAAHLLRGIPIYGGSVQGELCTPTGAALLKYFVDSFGAMPVITPEKIGYGMGKKNFETVNAVRTLLCQTSKDDEDEIYELRCNVDDMTAEEIAFAVGSLFEGGAIEVFTVSAGMKKGRPGTILTCLCAPEKHEEILRLIFKHTSTLGVRENLCARHVLTRSEKTVETPDGAVRIKESAGFGVKRTKAEYEDLARIAREKDCSLFEARSLV